MSFHFNSKLVRSAEFSDVGDVGMIYKPDNCHLLPVIIQKRTYAGTNTLYFINEEVWSKLSAFNKAVLILHEIVYFEFQHDLSELTRSFVGVLISEDLEGYLNKKDFFGFLKKHNAPFFEQNGVLIDIRKPLTFNENLDIKIAFVKEGLYVNLYLDSF